ncbi:MAG TPA: EAL domain-containing protein, partial [Bacilli bacterium]|nr:EAL domain-containing protein [Bacilli bacterium]
FFQSKGSTAITACIGISQYPNDSSNAEELIKYAELAANKAKTEGKNTFKFFNPLDRNKLIHLVEMDIELRKSLDFKHFSLHYQPYVSMDDNNIIGYEALIRWNHPILGSISPAEFIPLAEKIGLIIPIGEWVLKTACMQHKKWQQKFSANRNVSVNLSPKQFDDPKLVEKIACILNQTGMDGRYLTLELTETTIIKNFRQASQKLSQLMELGIQIAIDDFGMDHSSLNYLKELPINKLKIDRSFVRDVLTDAKAKEILRTIVDLGHRLHFRVLAEGVEIKEQYDLLNSYDCDECQGYYISKPLSNIECEQFLSQVDKSMEWRFAK